MTYLQWYLHRDIGIVFEETLWFSRTWYNLLVYDKHGQLRVGYDAALPSGLREREPMVF